MEIVFYFLIGLLVGVFFINTRMQKKRLEVLNIEYKGNIDLINHTIMFLIILVLWLPLSLTIGLFKLSKGEV